MNKINWRFLGNYDELEKGCFEDSALFLSGGLHDVYSLKEINSNKKSSSKTPDKSELLEIIKIAILKQDLIGCITENVIFLGI